jgi:hypothetical protein
MRDKTGDQLALEFAKAVTDLPLPEAHNHEIVSSLGLSPEGLDHACTLLSMGILEDIKRGGLGFESQSQLFQLGVRLGYAYALKMYGLTPEVQ